MKHPDELELIDLLKTNSEPYQALAALKFSKEIGMEEKRLCSILDKWVKKGIFECGVTLRSGWITPKFFQ